LRWSSDAERQIVVIGDAEDRPDERAKTLDLLGTASRKGITTNFIEVRSFGHFADLLPAVEGAGGRILRHPDGHNRDLAAIILHCTLDETLATHIDDFYSFLAQWCQ
jgi:hypothetical protein